MIRPEDRARYPANWPDISEQIRVGRARGRCECDGECGRGHIGRCHRQQGDRLRMEADSPTVVLTVAHLDHTPENCDLVNLKAMCQACHLNYDRGHHAKTAARTRRERATAGMEPLLDLATPIDRALIEAMRAHSEAIAPGVLAHLVDTGPWIEVRAVLATEPRIPGAVGRWLDTLPRHRHVIVPAIVSPRLAGMLNRRGFILRRWWDQAIRMWDDGAMIRPAVATTEATP